MTDMIKKLINAEIKELEDRVLEFIGSTENQDRDGEVILASGWDLKNYRKNPVFLWAHNYSQPPIGKATNVRVKEGQLKFKIQFADYEFADTIYRLYKGGFLNATSVGFVPLEVEDGDGTKTPRRTYKKQELLELSGCAVPSNPDALRLACDSGVVTVKQLSDIGLVTKPEETDDYIRIPVRECEITATINISEKEGIKALYCGNEKKVATYLFAKDKGWTMEKAKAWVKEHGGKSESISETASDIKIQPKSISPAMVQDEIDYLKDIITEQIDDKTKEMALELARLIDTICAIKTESVTTDNSKVEPAPQQTETFDYNKLMEMAKRAGITAALRFQS